MRRLMIKYYYMLLWLIGKYYNKMLISTTKQMFKIMNTAPTKISRLVENYYHENAQNEVKLLLKLSWNMRNTASMKSLKCWT